MGVSPPWSQATGIRHNSAPAGQLQIKYRWTPQELGRGFPGSGNATRGWIRCAQILAGATQRLKTEDQEILPEETLPGEPHWTVRVCCGTWYDALMTHKGKLLCVGLIDTQSLPPKTQS